MYLLIFSYCRSTYLYVYVESGASERALAVVAMWRWAWTLSAASCNTGLLTAFTNFNPVLLPVVQRENVANRNHKTSIS